MECDSKFTGQSRREGFNRYVNVDGPGILRTCEPFSIQFVSWCVLTTQRFFFFFEVRTNTVPGHTDLREALILPHKTIHFSSFPHFLQTCLLTDNITAAKCMLFLYLYCTIIAPFIMLPLYTNKLLRLLTMQFLSVVKMRVLASSSEQQMPRPVDGGEVGVGMGEGGNAFYIYFFLRAYPPVLCGDMGLPAEADQATEVFLPTLLALNTWHQMARLGRCQKNKSSRQPSCPAYSPPCFRCSFAGPATLQEWKTYAHPKQSHSASSKSESATVVLPESVTKTS